MDGLLKTARLTHSVFRIQEDRRAAQTTCNIRYRRHVCFSQAVSYLDAVFVQTEAFRVERFSKLLLNNFHELV